jgi:hypothetical protein
MMMAGWCEGWIHTLLEEAENERMHLMIFLELRRPGLAFRTAVILTQWLFTISFSTAYFISPHLCYRSYNKESRERKNEYSFFCTISDPPPFIFFFFSHPTKI